MSVQQRPKQAADGTEDSKIEEYFSVDVPAKSEETGGSRDQVRY